MSITTAEIAPQAAEHTECHAASFAAASRWPSTTVVTADGELDAANARQFVDYALQFPERSDRLILDLSGLTFFGTEAFSAIHTLNVRCAASTIPWALVPSAAVTRLLRICDPDSALPVSSSVETAVIAVAGAPRASLQLVPEPR